MFHWYNSNCSSTGPGIEENDGTGKMQGGRQQCRNLNEGKLADSHHQVPMTAMNRSLDINKLEREREGHIHRAPQGT